MSHSKLFLHTGNNNYFLGCRNQISFDMTKAEYDKALGNACWGEFSEQGRIIVHEYEHWVQSTGSPYGFYLELVYHYENELLQKMEELIAYRLYNENGIKVSPPFKKYIENPLFYNVQDEKLWRMFDHWLDLYFLIKLTEERRDNYNNLLKQYEGFFRAYPKCENTKDIDNYYFLPRLFSRVDDFLDRKLSEFIGREVPPKCINDEDLYTKKNIEAVMIMGLNGISTQITHHSLWESYATVVEYLDTPEEFSFSSQFKANNEQKPWDEYYEPLRYLEFYLPSPNYDKLLFLKSCLVIFDIAFSPPILPQCKPFREDHVSMYDFDIISRFYAAAQTAGRVGLMSDYSSAGEYSTAICRALNWRTPDEIFLQLWRCWDSLDVVPAGRMLQCFIAMRVAGEYLALNRIRFLGEVRNRHINPCFLKFKDYTITNTRLAYDLSFEALSELSMYGILFQQDNLFPEPLSYDEEYYRYYLLRELVEKIWEEESKVIILTIPKECKCYEKVKTYLQSWINGHNIDAQCVLMMT